MAKDCKDILLTREGTSQSQRFLKALNPENLKLHDFSTEDWVMFAYTFAGHVNFFETSDHSIPMGNWEELFNLFQLPSELPFRGTSDYDKLTEKVKEILDEFKGRQRLTPHLTLFISFLELLSLSQNRFNKLTKRHLDFYYKEVLQIEKQLPESDKAHIIFELAKRIEDYKVSEDTQLNAGKDANGANLIFETVKELIANKATVGSLKNIYNDTEKKKIKASQIANSFDGLGAEFPEGNAFWHPFGHTLKPKDVEEQNESSEEECEFSSDEDETPELEDAALGFAIASPMLSLAEGQRNVALRVSFPPKSLSPFTTAELLDSIEIWYTGEKKWEGPIALSDTLSFIGDQTNPTDLTTRMTETSLQLVFQLDRDMKPLAPFNTEVHLDSYDTDQPLVKAVLKTHSEIGYDVFRELVHKPISAIDIEVSVTGVQNMVVENDTGVLKPDKPFYPFTTQPTKRSNFYVDYSELFEKEWDKVSVDLLWKSTPNSFKTHYFAYREDDATSSAIYADSIFIEENSNGAEAMAENQPENVGDGLADFDLIETALIINPDPDNLIVKTDDHFKATSYVLHKEEWDLQDPQVNLFTDEDEDNLYNTLLEVTNKNYALGKSGPIKLSLNQSFLQEMFPKIYALALASTNPNTLVPNAPYVPFVETIELSYSAKESTDFTKDSEEAYDDNRVKLFHHTPFGQHEEHLYLKSESISEDILKDERDSKRLWLVPDYCHGGELYIGLKDAKPRQTMSVLFQILEGSENPEADSFEGNQAVEWSVLCNDHWKDLTDFIVSNDIDNFLKSGIVSFSIPKQATDDNTRLPAGYIWVKAKIHKQFDAVCKVIDIKAQAVTAQFENNDNDLAHLETGLAAGTIAKLVNRVPQIKSISQPFSSFGGRPLEEDTLFYRRVSERLRHKNRAITIWDYEHLILEKFPEIFKVLCLKHTELIRNNDGTTSKDFLSPGHVNVVVIPDIVNKNVFDIYQPRVSKATLNKIQKYINALNSMHVEAQVVNPDYEEITVSLNVKFHTGFDESYYKKEMNLDITRFLSPWAFDSTKNIAFGVELHASVLIDFLEDLPYVDFLEDVFLVKKGDEKKKVVSPSQQGSILVSAKNHCIHPITNKCKNIPVVEAEECQY